MASQTNNIQIIPRKNYFELQVNGEFMGNYDSPREAWEDLKLEEEK